MGTAIEEFLVKRAAGAALYVGQSRRAQFIPSEPFIISSDAIALQLDDDCYPLSGSYLSRICQRLPGGGESNNIISVAVRHLKNEFKVKSFCVAPGNWTPHIRPLQQHMTWSYVAEALAYAETGNDIHLDAIWQSGLRNPHFRFIQENVRVSTRNWKREEAAAYLDRLIGLVRIVSANGQIPSPDDLQGRSARADDHIGAAIDQHGKLLHFRKGHHRIALAKQLAIPTVALTVHVVHSEWLRELLNISDLEFRSFVSQSSSELHRVRTAIRHYVDTYARRAQGTV